MDVRRLSRVLAVAPQLSIYDVEEAARLGFRTLINNRPDGEEPTQPRAKEIEAAARAAGLRYHYLPVNGINPREHDIHAFGTLLAEARDPVLAFCRSGGRSVVLWAMTRAGRDDTEQIIAVARHAGFELNGLRMLIEQHLRMHSGAPVWRTDA